MKSKHIPVIIVILLIQTLACGNNNFIPITGDTEGAPSPAIEATEGISPTPATIGTVSNIRTQVYAGAPDNLKLINGETNLGNDDFVKVADGGKARLNFPGPISLLLYNQSEMDNIELEFENNSNPRIVNRLIRGGFSGYVEPGNQLTIDLSFGVQINVLGTNFFVLFDEENGFITIGKFDGTLSVSMPGRDSFFLDDSELIDITPDGKLARYSPIPFTPAQFDNAADSCVSSIQGINILRRDNRLPLPGMNTFQENIELPCEPLSSPTETPGAIGCLTPDASVKADSVHLLAGPDLRFISAGEHKKNDKFTIAGGYQGWYLAEFPDGSKGWLYTDWIDIPPDVDITKICKIPYRDIPPTPKHRPICIPDATYSCQ